MFKRWGQRLLVCVLVAAVVSVLTLLVAWNNWRKIYVRSDVHHQTRATLDTLQAAVDEYRQTHGHYPDDVRDLPVVKEKRLPVGEDGTPTDGWGLPLHYALTDTGYELRSRGADRVFGGVGKYADLIAGQPDDWPESPSFVEFLQHPDAAPMRGIAIAAGVLVFPLFLLQAYPRREEPSRWKIVTSCVVIAVVAMFVAVFMMALQMMPSGH